jgi:hypothetical protein
MSSPVTAAYSGNVCLPVVRGRVYDDDPGEGQVAGFVDLRAGSVEQSPLGVGQWVTVLTGDPEARYEGHAASRYGTGFMGRVVRHYLVLQRGEEAEA